jgi:hypothetical protein
MADDEDEQLHRFMQDLTSAGPSQELVFDPGSGRLIVTPTPRPDMVVATDVAESGYF